MKVTDIKNNPIMEKVCTASGLVHAKIYDAFRYSAMTLNFINKTSKKDYDISMLTKIHIDLNPKDHRLTKNRFKLWVIGNCLTYMLEAFNTCIDSMLEIIDNYISQEDRKKLKKAKALNQKLEVLIRCIKHSYTQKVPLIVIAHPYIDAISSIREARNCIVHNYGVVNAKVLTQGYFELKWF